MSRLLDRILAFGVEEVGLGAPNVAALERFTVLDAQNVADYFYMGTSQEAWDKRDDFPCVLLPWTQTWIEWRQPHISNSEGKLVPMPGRHTFGFAMQQCEVSVPGIFDRLGKDPHSQRFIAAVEELCKWVLVVGMFQEDGHLRVGPRAVSYLGLDSEGRIGEWPRKFGGDRGGVLMATEAPLGAGDPELQVKMASTALNPTLFALSLLHCKNVKTEKQVPPVALSKAHSKRTGHALLQYHVLDVEPFRRVAEDSGAGATGIKRALHMCRGHMAEYTADAPLFGKYVGTFWIPQHTRGSVAYGSVAKDYRIVRTANRDRPSDA